MPVLLWGSEQLVNTTTDDNQDTAAVAALDNGGFAVVWKDSSITGGDTSGDAIRMQRFDAFGNKVGAEILVDTTTNGNQIAPSVATLDDGSFVVCWEDESGANGTGVDIRFRRFNPDGSAIDAGDVVATNAAAGQTSVDVAAISGGGFVISYSDIQSGTRDIFAQRFTAAGTANGAAIPVHGTADGEDQSAIAMFSNGSFVVTWRDFTTHRIVFQRVDASGGLIGGAIVVNNVVGGVAQDPNVAVLENGGFVIVWRDTNQPFPDTSGLAVRAQLFDANGNAVGSEFTVETHTAADQASPEIVATAGGGFVAVYQSDFDIRGQLFDGAGSRVGEEFLVNTSTNGIQTSPRIAVLGDGRLVVTWFDQSAIGDDTSGSAVRMQIIDPRDGSITGTDNAELLLGHDLVNDQLHGLAGADTLNGLAGADAMYGGDDSDTYVIDNPGDQAIELVGRGTDLVQASISFALGANVENVTLLAGAANATGNGLANVLTGNDAANTLNGLAGADTMLGLGGNDTYVVDNLLDTLSEAGGAGVDTVVSSVSFSLVASAHVAGALEKLTLTGASAITGTGNAAANTIVGNAAANTLSGGAAADLLSAGGGNDRLLGGIGNDKLTGGANNDIFVFNTAPNGSTNRDTITDFNHVQDTIQLDNAVFTKLGGNGALNPAFFHLGAAAADADDHVIYNQATGALVYDSNGTGAGGAVQFATLINKPVVAANDFVVI